MKSPLQRRASSRATFVIHESSERACGGLGALNFDDSPPPSHRLDDLPNSASDLKPPFLRTASHSNLVHGGGHNSTDVVHPTPMLLAPLTRTLRRKFASMATQSKTPVEDIIRTKVCSLPAPDAFRTAKGRVGDRSLKTCDTRYLQRICRTFTPPSYGGKHL